MLYDITYLLLFSCKGVVGLKQRIVDVVLFMGQSNMAGRGIADMAPQVQPGMGYEYRAITAPNRLTPLQEPFGKDENNPDGVYEPGMKTGSMVSAFVNAAQLVQVFRL